MTTIEEILLLKKYIKPEMIEEFFFAYGGNNIYIPKLYSREIRNSLIIREYKNTHNIKTIAKKYNLTKRHIYNLIKKMNNIKGV